MFVPTLNIDAGEMVSGEPPELIALADVVNIACGGHAGDDESMRRVVALGRVHGTLCGAHPSYRDRPGFGRQPESAYESVSLEQIRLDVAEQCSRLARIAAESGVTIAHAKPHGTLYHAADRSKPLAEAVVSGVIEGLSLPAGAITLIGPPPRDGRGALAAAAARVGMIFAREGFADRGVTSDGSLIARGQPGALITDPSEAAPRAIDLARSGSIDTLCVHGDSPGAVAIARAVRAALDRLSESA